MESILELVADKMLSAESRMLGTSEQKEERNRMKYE